MKLIEASPDYSIYSNEKGGKFWGNMGAGVLPICLTTKRILICLRSPYVNEPGTWGVAGGAMDEGEKNPSKSAMREMKEELGYKGKVKLLKSYVYKSPDGTFQYHNFLGLVEKEFKAKLDWETSKVEWVSYSNLKKKPLHFGLKALLQKDGRRIQKLIGG